MIWAQAVVSGAVSRPSADGGPTEIHSDPLSRAYMAPRLNGPPFEVAVPVGGLPCWQRNRRTDHVRGAMGLRRIWRISHGRLDHSRHCRRGRGGLAPTIRFFVMRAEECPQQPWVTMCVLVPSRPAARSVPIHVGLALDLDLHSRIDQFLHLDQSGGRQIVPEIRDAARVDLFRPGRISRSRRLISPATLRL